MKNNFYLILKSILPDYFISKIKKYLYGNLLKTDIEYNSNLLEKNFASHKDISDLLKKSNLNYNSRGLSWHYHLFAAIKIFTEKKSIKINNILEIGTHNGNFTNFLSDIFENSSIYTIDLPSDDFVFRNTYRRSDSDDLIKYLEKKKII